MSHTAKKMTPGELLLLSFSALGVVYGDIGTSPLYSVNEIFFGHGHVLRTMDNVLGAISIVIWALTIIVSFKYIIYVLRADNDGEGGVFALYGLLQHKKGVSIGVVSTLLIFAAGLLFGDGIITPAISVLSAVEGLKVATSTFEPYIIPITIAILTALFMIQKNGTSQVGKLFGPVISVWFVVIGLLGFSHIMREPGILAAINPLHAYQFIISTPFYHLLLVLGSVMLVVTGGEAMYADMGHFGRSPIRISWFSLTYPALLLNYLGQGAYLLSPNEIVGDNIFYSMVPKVALVPMVILATLATVIASQALISGAFSLFTQAVGLNLFPRAKIKHTHEHHMGQIYVPFINWTLYIGCVLLVIGFKTSTDLAAAYGLAVSGVMLITSLGMFLVATHYWKWSAWQAGILFVPLALIDASFLMANSLKLFQGGYIPLMIALFILAVMKTWKWGRAQVIKTFKSYPAMTVKDLCDIKQTETSCIPRSIVIMTPYAVNEITDSVPPVKQLFWERYGLLPKHLLFLHVVRTKDPYNHEKRYDITSFYDETKNGKGSIVGVQVYFGFLEEPNVELMLADLAAHHQINIDEHPDTWLIHIMQERIFMGKNLGLWKTLQCVLYQYIDKLAATADMYFGLGKEKGLTAEIMPVVLE